MVILLTTDEAHQLVFASCGTSHFRGKPRNERNKRMRCVLSTWRVPISMFVSRLTRPHTGHEYRARLLVSGHVLNKETKTTPHEMWGKRERTHEVMYGIGSKKIRIR